MAVAKRFRKALADNGLDVLDPDRDHLPGDDWAGKVARALEESNAMAILLTSASVSSPHVKRDRIPATEIPWIVRRMPWFELNDSDTEPPKVAPIAEAILSHA